MYDWTPIPPGGRSPTLQPAQAMFLELSQLLDGLQPGPVDGRHLGPSVQNVLWLQRMLGQAQTGVLDGPLFFRLTHLHRLCRRCGNTEL